MKIPRRNTFATAAVLALSSALGQAGTISYNWDLFGTVPTNSSSFAGVVSAANWNNSWPGRNSPPTASSPTSNLIDSSGAVTTLDIHFSGTGQWQLNPLNTAPPQDLDGTYNKRLLKGYVDMVGGQPVSVTLSEIPYAQYDVYIYLSSDTAGREGYVTDGASTFYFSTSGSAAISGDNAVLAQATETTDLTPNAAATYARFSNLTGTSKTLTVFAQGNGGIAGIQVVEVSTPQNDGIWIAGAGNWSDTASWSGGTVAQGAGRTATFDGLSPATATVDGIFPIGSLLFSNADHTVAAGSGTLLLQNSLATPSISVESGRTATVGAALLGSGGLQKTSAGTLVMTANSGVTGTTDVLAGTLVYQDGYASASHSIATTSALELQVASGTRNGAATSFTGGGTLRKTGAGTLIWPASAATFALDPGALIDVREGTLVAGSFGNEVWIGNLSDLNVESGATFSTVEANVRVDKITGSGTIGTGFNGAGYQSLSIGVADGSSTFAGSIANTDANPIYIGNLVKEGTGTITLAGANTYSGNTTVAAGTLQVAATGSLRFRPGANGITNSVAAAGTGALSFLGSVDLDLAAANTTGGNVWNLFNLGSFTVAPDLSAIAAVTSNLGSFTEDPAGTWELSVPGATWVFTEADGNLAYVVTATDYDTWKSANAVIGGDNDDDDNDGLTNREEYAFGLDPTGGSSVNPFVAPLNQAAKTFSYQRRDNGLTGLTYTVWYSTDLTGWVEDTAASQPDGTPDGNGVETINVTLSSQPGDPLPARLFVQVRAN